jgi:hypothetical protein
MTRVKRWLIKHLVAVVAMAAYVALLVRGDSHEVALAKVNSILDEAIKAGRRRRGERL